MSASYGSIDPWSHFSYGIGFYHDDYSLSTDQTNYNDIYLNVRDMISVGGKNSGYSPFVIPAEYYMYEENGQGVYEYVYLMPVLKGGSYDLISEDVFPVDETGRQPWGKKGVRHFYFIDESTYKIGYKESVQPYVGVTIVDELQELPWPHYLSKQRRIILYPVTEEKGIALGKEYDNETYVTPDFYVDTDMYSEDYYQLLPQEPVLNTADSWAQSTIELAMENDIKTDRMTKMYYKMPTNRSEFSELMMAVYDKLGGPEIIVSDNPFKDTDDEWILKANKAGIVNGISEDLFDPEGEITREMLCVMIVRGLESAGSKIETQYEFSKNYKDSELVAEWAKSSMMTLNQAGVYKGSGEYLSPKETVDKQSAIILLYRAYEHYK